MNTCRNCDYFDAGRSHCWFHNGEYFPPVTKHTQACLNYKELTDREILHELLDEILFSKKLEAKRVVYDTFGMEERIYIIEIKEISKIVIRK